MLLHAGAALRFQPAHTIRSAGGCRNGKLQKYLLRQLCSNLVEFFLQHTEDTDAKKMDQNLEIQILLFFRTF